VALATIVDMKIQINITNSQKSIKIEESIKLNDLIIALDKMFPNKEWTDFLLETNTTIQNWTYPIYYPIYPPAIPQKQWWEEPWITYLGDSMHYAQTHDTDNISNFANKAYSLNVGTYNIEI
jgi:hypothetical protein